VGKNVKMLMTDFCHNNDDSVANYMRTVDTDLVGSISEVIGKRKDGSIFPK